MEDNKPETVREFQLLNGLLGYFFQNQRLMEEAFCHSSFANESGDPDHENNERLEFLGDAVLDLAISHVLMERFDDAREGDLSKYRARVVNERGLCQVARGLCLGDYILLGKGEEITGGREKPSILANTMEALLGAIYLDGGFSAAKEIIARLFLPLVDKIERGRGAGDSKSRLQEYTQDHFKTRPEYLLISESGPAHDKTFVVAISLNNKIMAEGEGKSKKVAEQKAAREAYRCLTKGL
jgi:ribonuclease-3